MNLLRPRREKLYKLLITLAFIFIPLVSLGYSALQTTLTLSTDVESVGFPTLYNVLRDAALVGTYASEYTGLHQDTMNGVGSQKIYYWSADSDASGTAIQNMNNVIFAGYCWQILRTTDTGGVKLIYNGEPENDECLSSRGTHVGYSNRTSNNLSGDYYYGTDYTYDSSSNLFTLSGSLTHSVLDSSTVSSLIGKYTCRQTTANATCGTLYLVESFNRANYGYVIPISKNSAYSQYGTLQFNANENSLAYTGYMYNIDTYQKQLYQVSNLGKATYNTSALAESSYNVISNNSTYPYSFDSSTQKWKASSSDSGVNSTIIFKVNTSGDYILSYKLYADTYDSAKFYVDDVLIKTDTGSKEGYVLLNSLTTANEIKVTMSLGPGGGWTKYLQFQMGTNLGIATDNRYLFGDSVIYNNGSYTLQNTIRATEEDDLTEHHYTCFSTTNTCSTVNYIYMLTSEYVYYIELTDENTIEDALSQMLNDNSVNNYDSTMKFGLDKFYEKNLYQYGPFLEDTIYCNDRSIESLGGWDPDGGGLSIANSNLLFKNNTVTSSLSCTNNTDKFAVSNNIAKLDYPIGLVTAPEMNLLNNNNARNNGNHYLTMSPAYNTSGERTVNRNILTTGSIGQNSYGGVRPVISLAPGIEYDSGTGAMDDPYIIDIQTYTINYNSNNGSGCSGTITVPVGGYFGDLCTPTRSNWLFMGWNTSSDGTGATVTSNTIVPETNPGTLYAMWAQEATFLPGEEFNVKIKKLSGQSDATYSTQNTTITSFEKANTLSITPTSDNIISIDESAMPIYAWYDNETIYYYSDVDDIYLNSDASRMFYQIRGLESVDFQNVSTIKTINMSYMFYAAGRSVTTFDTGDLSNLDTSSVTDMSYMFSSAGYGATTFELDLSEWDTSSVTDMSYMFSNAGYSATTFELDLSDWDTSSVAKMNNMFASAGHDATTWSINGLSSWDTSSVTDMSYMFSSAGYSAATFDIDYLSSWDISSVTNMQRMFRFAGYSATTINVDLSGLDASSVTTMNGMLSYVGYNAATIKLDLSEWDASSVTTVSSMFTYTGYNATTIELDLSGWDISSVTNMNQMFSCVGYNATTIKLDLSNWNTSNVTDMHYMFESAGYSAKSVELDLSGWNTSNVTDMHSMFYNLEGNYSNNDVEKLSIIGLSSWDTSSVTNMSYMFSYAGYSATTFDIGDLSNWDTSNVTNMHWMFALAGNDATTFEIDLSNWDTSNVTDMHSMFGQAGYNATTWSIGDLSGWNTSNVTDMQYMFKSAGYSATTFDIGDLSNWDTSNVTNMSNMFVAAGHNSTTWNVGGLSNWDTSSVTNMSSMFGIAGHNATTFELDLSNWDTSSVTNMSTMFSGAGDAATTWSIGDLSNWDTSSVTDMRSMLYGAGYNATTFDIGDLSNWDTSNVTDMSEMFESTGRNATTWNIGTLNIYATDINSMFSPCPEANATLNIYSNPTSYTSVFTNAATATGASITVNYASTTTNIDSIIATKSSNSNVVKGSVLP